MLTLKVFFSLFLLFSLVGCINKQPIFTKSATVVFKTPTVKFYDKGFVEKYDDKVNLTIFNLGISVLDIDVYENKICQDSLFCMSGTEFNEKVLNTNYKSDFLYRLLNQENINFKDIENMILIKILYDKQEDNNDTTTH